MSVTPAPENPKTGTDERDQTMKIHVTSTGRTTIDADKDYQEPQIRAALEELAELGPDETGRYLPDVAVAIIDHTDSERSDIDHDEYATVTEDDGTELWSGWLDGRNQPKPLDVASLRQLAADWQAVATAGALGDAAEARRSATLLTCARQLDEALGQPS